MAGKGRPTFCVGSSSDPARARRAVAGLRAMARMGRIAEAVLLDISEKGWSDRRSYWVSKGWRKEKEFVLSDFPAFTGVSRDDVPGYASIRLELSDPFEDGKFQAAKVRLVCQVLGWGGGKPKWRDGVHPVVGHVRFTSKGGTVYFKLPGRDSQPMEGTHGVKLSGNPRRYWKRIVADSVAAWVTSDGGRPGAPVFAARLREELPGWILEDGTADRMILELWRIVSDRSLVSKVMSA